MKLEELAKVDRRVRLLLLSKLPHNLEYQMNIDKGLRFFTADELAKIEKDKQKKLTYKEIDEILSRKGMILKLATFKKYINLNLISSSVGRVNKSSVGLYSPNIIREINFIKYALFSNLDLKTFYKTFGTNAYDMINNSWGADPLCSPDWVIESNETGDSYTDKLKRMLAKLYEEKIINLKEKNKIFKILDKISYLSNKRYSMDQALQESLEKIDIPNPQAFLILDWRDAPPKDNNKKTKKI